MDAPEFYKCIVKPNYDSFDQGRGDIRLAWNAAVSMNSVAEYVALHRSGYAPMTEDKLSCEANKIRKCFPPLEKLNGEVITLKHVRNLRGIKKVNLPLSSNRSSTAYLPDVPLTWEKLAQATDDAFATVSQFVELK